MQLTFLGIENFRNISNINIKPGKGLNVITGDNGEGKTNILEAIYFLGNLKCFRTPSTRKCIQWGKERFSIFARGSNGKEYNITYVSGGELTRKINGKKVNSNEYLKNLNIVGFFPQEEVKVFSSPEQMRKLIDRGIFYLDKSYLVLYKKFTKLLENRNTLLREGYDEKLLDVLTEEFIIASREVERKRKEFIEEITPFFKDLSQKIGSGEWETTIEYSASKYEVDLKKEIEAGFTLFGAHRGNVKFTINGRDIRDYGSQGQIKVVLLSYKLCILKLLYSMGETPVFLADDIGGEFDKKRRDNLINFLEEEDIQSFLTSPIDINIRKGEFFRVKEGKVWKL